MAIVIGFISYGFAIELIRRKKEKLWNRSDDFQFRILRIICTDKGSVIVFCEQRNSEDDWSAKILLPRKVLMVVKLGQMILLL